MDNLKRWAFIAALVVLMCLLSMVVLAKQPDDIAVENTAVDIIEDNTQVVYAPEIECVAGYEKVEDGTWMLPIGQHVATLENGDAVVLVVEDGCYSFRAS